MTDYCSFSPEGNWADACKQHDIDYAVIREMRKKADMDLKNSITKKGFPTIAKIYFIAVRIFGRIFV